MTSTAPACPDRSVLARFAAGLASPAEAESVAPHLATCSACLAVCDSLPPDRLERALHGLLADADGLSAECVELMRRAHDTAGRGHCVAVPDTCSGLSAEVSTEPDGGAAPPCERLGRYRLVRRIGSGGMGAVHEAIDEVLDRRVAVKIPHATVLSDPVARERFQREARAAAAIDHPGVCRVLDVGEVEGTSYITMPLLTGESLAARLARAPRVPLTEALAIARALAAAVDAIHAGGIVHRDIKPANVFLTTAGGVVLMDFGIAAPVGPAPEGDRLTHAGATLGTIAYAAPEQVAGEWDRVGPAADVWAVGVVLHELLTGTTPFTGPPGRISAGILHRTTPRPTPLDAACDRRLVGICLGALAKDPARRPARAGLIADQIAAWESRHARGAQRNSPAPAVAAAGALLVVAGIAIGVQRGLRAPVPGGVAPLTGPPSSTGAAPADAGKEASHPAVDRVGTPDGAAMVPLPAAPEGWSLTPLAGPQDVFAPAGSVRPGGVVRATASRDGRVVALLHDGPHVSLWDTTRGARTRWMLLPPFDTTLALLPDGGGLVTAGGGWVVRIWHLGTGLETATLPGHGNWINTVAVTADGRCAVSSSKDGTLRGWDLVGSGPLWQKPQGRWVRCCAVSADGTRAACGNQDGFVRLVTMDEGRPSGGFRATAEPVVMVAFAAADTVVVFADATGRLAAWDLATGRLRWERACRAPGPLVVAPAGNIVATIGPGGELSLIDVADGASVVELPGGPEPAQWLAAGFVGPAALAVRRDGWMVTLRRR